MKNFSAKQAISVIVQTAKEYELKLNNRHFLVVYRRERDTRDCIVGFRDMNYLHLTGVRTNLSATVFYAACLNGKLSVRDFSVDTGGKVQQKLQVLPYLPELLYHNCMIGDFINSGISIKADYFIGGTRTVLSVGFREGRKSDIPVSLYNENIKVLTKPTCKVLGIFRKLYHEDKFGECVYLAKDYKIEGFPSNIKEKFEKNMTYPAP